MIKVTNLTKFYGPQKVLNKISFNLEKGHKIALVGYNGTGKSTLLKILAGQVERDAGQIAMHDGINIGFLPQETKDYHDQIVIDFIESYSGQGSSENFSRTVEIMFAGFGLPSEIKSKSISELSSGQKTKVFLTALLLKKVDLMLLDEPTNNLDLPALIWLEDFLKKTKCSFIVVSHDKVFLDRVTNKIYEIEWRERTLRVINGKYSDYLAQKEKEMSRQLLEHELQLEEMHRLQKLAEQKREDAIKGSKWAGTDNDKMLRGFKRNRAGYSFKESKVVFARIKRMKRIDKPNFRRDFKIDILPEENGVSRDIALNNLICGYGEDFRIGPFNLSIPFGHRICIMGLNGTGKSTILKTLTGSIAPLDGEIEIGGGVKLGNLMQEHETLPDKETIVSFLLKRSNLTEELVHNKLVNFGFDERQFKTKIMNLSPGGRARLLLALFSATNVNVLVLDEPTNHLDLEAETALEKTLSDFAGTVIVVTHDRSFVQKHKFDHLCLLEEGALNKIENFEEYVSAIEMKSRKLLRMLNSYSI